MKKLLPALICALAVTGAAALAGHAQEPARQRLPQKQTIKMVKPGLYMVVGDGGNVTVRVTPDGLIVVDSKNKGAVVFKNLMEQIRTVSYLPVRYLFLTHSHGDHAGNDQAFLDMGAHVIGEAGMPHLIDIYVAPAGSMDTSAPAKPDITYTGHKTVELGGVKVTAYHYAPGHTSADSIIYFPDLKTIAGGDEIDAGSPNLDYPMGANVAGWIRSVNAALKLDWDTCIPGHGNEPMTRAQVIAWRDKMVEFNKRGHAAVRAGATEDTLIANLKVDDLGWRLRNPFPQGQLDGLYKEMSGK